MRCLCVKKRNLILRLVDGSLATEYLCFSGPCMTLLLSRAGDTPDVGDQTIEYFRDLIGPKDVNIAKEEAPTR